VSSGSDALARRVGDGPPGSIVQDKRYGRGADNAGEASTLTFSVDDSFFAFDLSVGLFAIRLSLDASPEYLKVELPERFGAMVNRRVDWPLELPWRCLST
jgi:hypothetical protein